MAFPLGYAEGIAFAVDLERLEANCPEILREAGFRPLALRKRLLADGPAALAGLRGDRGRFRAGVRRAARAARPLG